MMCIKKILLASLLLSFSFGKAQEKVTGYVFEDLNKNGVKESKELGLANVLVSNGEEVVSTNDKGAYNILLKEGQTLFVIKPSGYQFLLDEYNLPKFYYNYRPQGSPKLKFKAIEPTGKLPKQANFGLLPTNESENFSALVFGDPQAYTLEEIKYFKDGVIADLDKINNYSFGISLGDLVGDDLDLHLPYKEAVKTIGLPWYNVIGNHDMNYDATIDEHSDESFERNFGPNNYSYNFGKVHFIVLDDILYPDPRDGKGYWGGFREDQLKFIENDLKFVPKEHLIVLAFHIPLDDENADSFRVSDRNSLFELLKEYPNTLSLSAHTHIQQQIFYGKEEGWKQEKPHHEYNVGTTSGDWYSGLKNEKGIPVSTMRDGTPKGYALIHFNGNSYNVDYKVVDKELDHQMNIFVPKMIDFKNPKNKHFVYANFFMGKENDEVLCKIDNGDWKKMEFTKSLDPAYASNYYQWDLSEKGIEERRPSEAMKSTHLWKFKIPSALAKGQHNVEIKATDMYGKTSKSNASFEIK